jgi:hypothetical protein
MYSRLRLWGVKAGGYTLFRNGRVNHDGRNAAAGAELDGIHRTFLLRHN